ncbi:MAG: hypothetical protein HYV15_01415, partial [Elusimicrobia bacterium]|nr:hypothetical protein [Elusimicrobiota bacterium]
RGMERLVRDVARRARRHVAAAPFPSGDGTTLLSAWNLGVARSTDAPREAFALLRWLVGGAASASYAQAVGEFPAAEGAAIFGSEDPELRDVFEEAFSRTRLIPNLSVLGSLERVFERGMERLVRDVARRRWTPEAMREELIHAASEVDYILSFYAS